MRLIQNLSIKHKIMSIAIVGVIGFTAYFTINYQVTSTNSERLSNVRYIYFPLLERSDKNIVNLDKITETWTSAVTTGDEDLADDAKIISDQVHEVFQEMTKIDPSLTNKIKQLKQAFDDYFNAAKVLSIGIINEKFSPNKVRTLSEQTNAHLKNYDTALNAFRKSEYNRFHSVLEQANNDSKNYLVWGLIISVLVIIILYISATVISKTISGGINKIKHAMERLSEGDLTTHIHYPGTDEIAQLVSNHNSSLLKLRELVDGIINRTDQLFERSDSLLIAMSNTEGNVTSQKQESEHLATAITEMATSIQEVAKNASDAVTSTAEADAKANEGLDVVNKTGDSIQKLAEEVEAATSAIHSLEKDSENIGTVLEVIKGIAEQTNLLALNAAIEAARAGEQGRGFAVVADEVRTLASRTQESTMEIQQTIEKLQLGARQSVDVMSKGRTQAHESVEHSNSAGKLLIDVTNSMGTVSEMNTQIATAIEKQSTVAEEININIVSINSLADKTTTCAKKSIENALEVGSLSKELTQLVNHFKVK